MTQCGICSRWIEGRQSGAWSMHAVRWRALLIRPRRPLAGRIDAAVATDTAQGRARAPAARGSAVNAGGLRFRRVLFQAMRPRTPRQRGRGEKKKAACSGMLPPSPERVTAPRGDRGLPAARRPVRPARDAGHCIRRNRRRAPRAGGGSARKARQKAPRQDVVRQRAVRTLCRAVDSRHAVRVDGDREERPRHRRGLQAPPGRSSARRART